MKKEQYKDDLLRQSVLFIVPVFSVDVPGGHEVHARSSGLSLYVPTGQSLQWGFIGSDVSRNEPSEQGTTKTNIISCDEC